MVRFRRPILFGWRDHGLGGPYCKTLRSLYWRAVSCIPGDFSRKRDAHRKTRETKKTPGRNSEHQTRPAGGGAGCSRRCIRQRWSRLFCNSTLESPGVIECSSYVDPRLSNVAWGVGPYLAVPEMTWRGFAKSELSPVKSSR